MALIEGPSLFPDILEDAGDGGSNVSISFSGTPNQTEYDVYNSSARYKSSMYFHRKGLGTLTISNPFSVEIKLNSLQLWLGDKLFAKVVSSDGSDLNYSIAANGKAEFDMDLEAVDYDRYRPSAPDNIVIGTGATQTYFYNDVTFNEPCSKKISVTVTYTKNNIQINTTYNSYITINFYNPVLTDVWIVTGNIEKTDFELNEPFTYDDVVVKAEYRYKVSDFQASTFEVTSYNIAIPDTSTEGVKDVVITYSGFTCSYQITVAATYIKTFEVDFSSIVDECHVDYTLDIRNISATLTIVPKIPKDENDRVVITPSLSEMAIRVNATPVTDTLQLSNKGIYTLIVSYTHEGETHSKSKEIEVLDAVKTDFTVNTQPNKPLNSYVDTQKLDLSGLKFNIVYNVETTYEGSRSYLAKEISIYLDDEPIDKTNYIVSMAANGKVLKAKLTDDDFEDEVELGTLTVVEKELVSIEVSTKSNGITTYTYGDTFSLEGIIVNASFNSGDVDEIEAKDLTSNYDKHVFSKTDFTQNNETENVEISYTYKGVTKTTSYEITYVLPTFEHLEVNTDEAQTIFAENEVFVEDDIKVYAVYKNGYKEEITNYSSNAATVLNLDSDNKIRCLGIKTITVTSTNPYDVNQLVTATYEVSIETTKQVVLAYPTFKDEDLVYYVGDTFDAHGITFTVKDVDGNISTSSNFTTNPVLGTIFRSARVHEVQFTYSNGEYSVTHTLNIQVTIDNKMCSTEELEYTIAVGDANGNLFSTIKAEETTIYLGLQEDGSYIYPIFPSNKVMVDTEERNKTSFGLNIYTGDDVTTDCVGYMDLGLQDEYGNIIRNSHVIFFQDFSNPIEGDGNVVVTFPHYTKGHSDRINKCKFGKVYNKRLFVSGNPNYKNVDWHSGEINISQIENYDMDSTKDYTYFSDLDYCKYGSDETAVVGYDIYRDGDLIVFKESSRTEATIYKRTSTLINAIDYAGNIVSEDKLVEDAYPCYDINSNGGEGSFTEQTIVNFVGDTLFLTRSGLKVLSSKETTSNNAKYSYDVSSYINTKITNEELEKAMLYSHKERLILKTKRGIYFGEYNTRNEENEYEWYFIENVNAELFFEYDDELYFADNEGNIKKFPVNAPYVDKARTYIGFGSVLLVNEQTEDNKDVDNDGFYVDETENVIVVNKKYNDEIVEGRNFHLITTYKTSTDSPDYNCLIHASLGSFISEGYRNNLLQNQAQRNVFDHSKWLGLISSDNNTITIKPYIDKDTVDDTRLYDNIDLFYEGKQIYIDNIIKDGENYIYVQIDKPYTLKKYISDDFLAFSYPSYQLIDENGNVANLAGVNSFRLSFIASASSKTEITNIVDDDDIKTFKLLGDHNKVLDLIYYNERNDRYSAIITDEQPVKSYYLTKPFNMGSLLYEKTIWAWIVANDSELASSVDVGYIHSRKQSVMEVSLDTKGFDVRNINFSAIQFTHNKLPHMLVKNKTIPNVNFIRFVFKNDGDSNMVISQFSLLYSISHLSKGVK